MIALEVRSIHDWLDLAEAALPYTTPLALWMLGVFYLLSRG